MNIKSKHITYILSFLFILTNIPFSLQAQQTFTNRYESDILSSDSIFARYLHKQNIPITANNELTLLTSGKAKFNHLFKEIDKAKDHIHLEYFNFRNDSIAKELFTHLVHKAKEGVEIRAMFDAFGNMSNNRPLRKKHLQMLREHCL